jgi:hypothetical protein
MEAAYSQLLATATETRDARVVNLFEYYKRTWLESTTWHKKNISIYMQTFRTNNDCEGWHRRFNHLTTHHGAPSMYHLIQLLYRESKLCSVNLKLLSAEKLETPALFAAEGGG